MSIVTLVSYLIFGSVLGATFSNSSALKAAAWRKHCFCHAGGLGQFLNFLNWSGGFCYYIGPRSSRPGWNSIICWHAGCGQVKWNLLSSRVSMFAVCWLSKDGPSAYRDLIRGRPLLPPSDECRQSAEHMVQMVCGHSVRQTNNRTNQSTVLTKRTACVSWHTKLYKETTLLHS